MIRSSARLGICLFLASIVLVHAEEYPVAHNTRPLHVLERAISIRYSAKGDTLHTQIEKGKPLKWSAGVAAAVEATSKYRTITPLLFFGSEAPLPRVVELFEALVNAQPRPGRIGLVCLKKGTEEVGFLRMLIPAATAQHATALELHMDAKGGYTMKDIKAANPNDLARFLKDYMGAAEAAGTRSWVEVICAKDASLKTLVTTLDVLNAYPNVDVTLKMEGATP